MGICLKSASRAPSVHCPPSPADMNPLSWRRSGVFALDHKVMVSLAICFLGLPGSASLLRTRYQPFEVGKRDLWGSLPSRDEGVCAGMSVPPPLRAGEVGQGKSLSQGALKLLPHILVCPAGNPTTGSPLTSVACNA